MEFESPAHAPRDVLGVALVWAFGFGVVAFGVWQTATSWFWGIAVLDILLAYVSLASLWLGWRGSLHLKVELLNSPREARCWRKNIFTRFKTFHRYPIRNDAKVIVDYRGVTGSNDMGERIWPVNIEGLPEYYDFYILGHARDCDDAWAIGRTLASFLGLRFFDSKGDEHPVHDRGARMWYGPRPEADESPRGRRRRQRRKRA
jgi:hypothetical protein